MKLALFRKNAPLTMMDQYREGVLWAQSDAALLNMVHPLAHLDSCISQFSNATKDLTAPCPRLAEAALKEVARIEAMAARLRALAEEVDAPAVETLEAAE